MTHEQILQEIAALPVEGQKQVERFVVALRQSYSARPDSGRPSNSDWQAAGFIGMWADREDMRDSTAWVRERRELEWTN